MIETADRFKAKRKGPLLSAALMEIFNFSHDALAHRAEKWIRFFAPNDALI